MRGLSPRGGLRVRCPVLVGRDRELGYLRAVLDAGVGGCGATVVVRGEAGIGKSRLAHEVVAAVRAALLDVALDAPQGSVRVEGSNLHCHLTPRIGRSNAAGGFDVIYEAPRPVRPDPYLVWHDACSSIAAPRGRPSLRVVR